MYWAMGSPALVNAPASGNPSSAGCNPVEVNHRAASTADTPMTNTAVITVRGLDPSPAAGTPRSGAAVAPSAGMRRSAPLISWTIRDTPVPRGKGTDTGAVGRPFPVVVCGPPPGQTGRGVAGIEPL